MDNKLNNILRNNNIKILGDPIIVDDLQDGARRCNGSMLVPDGKIISYSREVDSVTFNSIDKIRFIIPIDSKNSETMADNQNWCIRNMELLFKNNILKKKCSTVVGTWTGKFGIQYDFSSYIEFDVVGLDETKLRFIIIMMEILQRELNQEAIAVEINDYMILK